MPTSQVTVTTAWTLLGTRTGTAESPGNILVSNLGAVMNVADSTSGEPPTIATTAGQILAAGTTTVPGGVLRDSGEGPVSWYGAVATGTGLAAVTVLDN